MSKNIFRRWLRRHQIYTGRINQVRYYLEHSDLPDVPPANELSIAGSEANPKWALLDCPCGHGHTVLLPLSKSEIPHWSLTKDSKRQPSIHPSIDRNKHTAAPRCHYWLVDGRVRWV